MIPLDRVRAMLAAATPGPWRRDREDGSIGSSVVVDAHDNQVADATGQAPARDPARRPVHEVQRANAALIAAAPDLAAQVLTLADALATAEASVAQLRAGPERADHERQRVEGERDAATERHATLAAAVGAALAAERNAMGDLAAAQRDQSPGCMARLDAAIIALAAKGMATDALLSAAPAPSTVPAALVREYLAASDAFDAACEAPFAPRSAAEGDARAADAVVVTKRAALDAALAGCSL